MIQSIAAPNVWNLFFIVFNFVPLGSGSQIPKYLPMIPMILCFWYLQLFCSALPFVPRLVCVTNRIWQNDGMSLPRLG